MILDLTADLVTILAVAIADGEQVNTLLAAEIRRKGVAILIYLVRVARLVPTAGSERKLGDHVKFCFCLKWCLHGLLRCDLFWGWVAPAIFFNITV